MMSEEEDEEENMTGPDYQYVISTAQGAEAHFKFKSEQEWEAAAGFVHQAGDNLKFIKYFQEIWEL